MGYETKKKKLGNVEMGPGMQDRRIKSEEQEEVKRLTTAEAAVLWDGCDALR